MRNGDSIVVPLAPFLIQVAQGASDSPLASARPLYSLYLTIAGNVRCASATTNLYVLPGRPAREIWKNYGTRRAAEA